MLIQIIFTFFLKSRGTIFNTAVASRPLAQHMKRFVSFIVVAALAAAARAELTIEITVQGAKQIPIAIAPFGGADSGPRSISKIVADDLARTGLFKLVDAASTDARKPADVNYQDWRGRGADAMVIGSMEAGAGGQLQVRFFLLDVGKQAQLASMDYSINQGQIRPTGHKIADIVYEKLIGEPGAFNTKITYVVKQGSSYQLKVADADGFNEQTILASNEPIISPAWSPDGGKVAYVTFEQRKPIVMVQSLATGTRTIVASEKGNNSAPAWSSDGKKLAVTLTKDGGSQLYVVNADGSSCCGDKAKEKPIRLSSSLGIDTEPAFSPDGKFIVFTSDRGGTPQIYRVSASGGDPQRMTFGGNYNVSPRFSPDGKKLIYIQRNNNNYRVALQELGSGQVEILTDSGLDESPSFAPNGRTILYATNVKGKGLLATVSSDGRIKQRLSTQLGDIREPAWGPFLR
jgi:TolB protein